MGECRGRGVVAPQTKVMAICSNMGSPVVAFLSSNIFE